LILKEKRPEKIFKKSLKKVLTNEKACVNIIGRPTEAELKLGWEVGGSKADLEN
jgi:hypothetical protein